MRARDLFEEARPNLRDMAEDLEDQGWTVTIDDVIDAALRDGWPPA